MRVHTVRKRFGQHFLQDKQVIQSIVDCIAPQIGQHIVEIGPGQGALTLPVLEKTDQLEVIELDRDLIQPLKVRCADKGRLIVHQADALKFDFASLVQPGQQLRVIGNLPYNISTPLIFHLLCYTPHILDMYFMLQKEVVERLAAQPGTEAYGRLSVMIQYHCQVVSLFHVSAAAFHPPPRVESSMVCLIPYREISCRALNYKHFALLVREAFSHRRKTLRNSLKKIISDSEWQMIAMDSRLRPEQLRVEDYVNISNQLQPT
jgi:16S rRNA (adenine1518-N6/adenine1519-N6)-dimethyltransferase